MVYETIKYIPSFEYYAIIIKNIDNNKFEKIKNLISLVFVKDIFELMERIKDYCKNSLMAKNK